MYRILSLDGGGIRGLLTCRLLEKLELAMPGVLSKFDLIAGTSSGALPALGLANGLTANKMAAIFQKGYKAIFRDNFIDNILDGYILWGAQYANDGLYTMLYDIFQEKTLADLLPRKVLIPTIDLDNNPNPGTPTKHRHWKSKFFHNFPGDDSDGHERIVDVALRSTAAPVYFPIYEGYVDGGLAANNPSMCALVQALDYIEQDQSLNDILLLSIGAGRNLKYISENQGDWGALQWAYQRKNGTRPAIKMPLLELMFDSNIGLVDYQCRKLLRKTYHRLDPILPYPIDIDATDQISHLNKLAGEKAVKMDVDETIAWLKEYF